MRIAIDYASAVWQGAGIGRYTRAMMSALLRRDGETRYHLLYPRGLPGRPAPFLSHLAALRQAHSNLRLHPLPLSDRYAAILWQRLRLPIPIEALCGPVDLCYSPDFVLPPQLRGRRIVTVHDLAYLVYPQCAVPSLGWYLHRAVPRSVARADLVLADSHSSRQDIIRLLGVPAERVRVVPLGVDAAYRPLEDRTLLEGVRVRYGLPGRFLLFVGTIEPRKNLPRLLEALAGLPEEERLPLVVVGKPGWLYEESFTSVARLGLGRWVYFLGFVPEEELPALYNLAAALVYPSLYEGFGLPPLEAMACGTPVLTSGTSSLPEVVGEAAVLVDPLEVVSIREGLQAIIQDGTLRERLRADGLERARAFTWERAAEELLQALGQRAFHSPAPG